MREPGRTAERIPRDRQMLLPAGAAAGPSAAPDFLSKTVASVDFMRLSLRRAAYVAAGRAAK